MKIHRTFSPLAIAALTILPRIATAQISITSWDLSATEATFTITGTTSVGFDPTYLDALIYIGVAGDDDWILSDTNNSTGNASGTINSYAASAASWGSDDNAGGDFIFFTNSSLGAYDFSSGGTINLTATVGGNYAPGNLNAADLIVSWGFDSNTSLPDVATQIGSFSAVPEPSTYATLFGAAALAGAIWWRRHGVAAC